MMNYIDDIEEGEMAKKTTKKTLTELGKDADLRISLNRNHSPLLPFGDATVP